MTKGTFDEGYEDGWLSVAGERPLPADVWLAPNVTRTAAVSMCVVDIAER